MGAKARETQVTALAAALLHCQAVDQLARTGALPHDHLRTAMLALLDHSTAGTLTRYREPDHLARGLELLEPFLRGEQRALRPEILRYMVGVLYLQRRLQKDADTRQRIYNGIERAAKQAELFTPTHENVLANVAQCYQDTLGKYRFRIQVRGESGYLRQPAVAERVRCMLFAAIRAAVLWHQAGGRRWQLMLGRRPLLAEIHRLKTGH